LKPGGFFSCAAIMTDETQIAQFRDHFRTSPMRLVKEEDITANVLRSRDLSAAAVKKFTGGLSSTEADFVRNWAAVPGTPNYDYMKTRQVTYVLFVGRMA
jgi:hypothetical protein